MYVVNRLANRTTALLAWGSKCHGQHSKDSLVQNNGGIWLRCDVLTTRVGSHTRLLSFAGPPSMNSSTCHECKRKHNPVAGKQAMMYVNVAFQPAHHMSKCPWPACLPLALHYSPMASMFIRVVISLLTSSRLSLLPFICSFSLTVELRRHILDQRTCRRECHVQSMCIPLTRPQPSPFWS